MSIKGKKILVTGSGGFIGRHLVERLKNDGAYVSTFDIAEGQNIEDRKKLASIISRKLDIIYHLAGLSGSQQSILRSEQFFKINTIGTLNLIEEVVKNSPKTKLVISSSRLEYGPPQYLPVDENHPTRPNSVYGLSRLAATQIAMVYHARVNLDVVILRTSNVYGHHHRIGFSGYNIVNHFIDLAKQNKTLKIFGNGKQLRDYLYIDDLIEAFIKAAAASGSVYNLGFGEGIEFGKMARLITKIVGRGNVVHTPWPKDLRDLETGSYVSDITKIRKELGFSPKFSFEEGIRRTVEFKI